MPCKKCLISKGDISKNSEKLAISKSLPQPCAGMYSIESWHIYSIVLFVLLNKSARICQNVIEDAVIQYLSIMPCTKCFISKGDISKNSEKLAIFKSLPQPCAGMYSIESRHIYSMVLLVLLNKSARICRNVIEDAVI